MVQVGEKPMLVHQVQQLRSVGCTEIRVVVSPSQAAQVKAIVEQVGIPGVTVDEQPSARGPVDAITHATFDDGDASLIVLFADTYLKSTRSIPLSGDSVAVSPAPSARQFCALFHDFWVDAEVEPGDEVAVGAYHFATTTDAQSSALKTIAASECTACEVGMAPFLSRIGAQAVQVYDGDWLDVGDIAALSRAQHTVFISRSFNELTLDDRGLLVKTGRVRDEAKIVADPPCAPHLYPRVFEANDNSYTMEYISSPTLASLWLYSPPSPNMWSHIASTLRHQLKRYHWECAGSEASGTQEQALKMYDENLAERYKSSSLLDEIAPLSDVIEVNGRRAYSGARLIEEVRSAARELLVPTVKWGTIHGDPNFTNILWDVKTSTFKLLDPRGSWGGVGAIGDIRYDVAKILYSPIFSAIAHDLFSVSGSGTSRTLDIWPSREEDTEVLYEEMGGRDTTTSLLVAWVLLSGAPLHDGDQAVALFLAGAEQAAIAGIRP